MNLPKRLRRFSRPLLLLLVALALLGPSVAAVRAAEKPAAKASRSKAAAPNDWKSLFDGKTLAGWKSSGFESGGEVKVENPFRGGGGAIVMEMGAFLSGVTWTNDTELPTTNYEIVLEAMKLQGSDFFCGLTFPVGKTACSFIVGGWGGTVVGLSSVDGDDASENQTTEAMTFEPNRWYRIRVRVTPEKIEAWIDDRQMVDLTTTDRKISLRFGDIENSLPLGIAAYQTRAALRDIRLRRL
ncbi:MAG: DUF1080 domain-containing protein [Verrucomicrobia bacterium]|nr:DUF1080 domain-containing protein [Verrucomicrobiota bacterium]